MDVPLVVVTNALDFNVTVFDVFPLPAPVVPFLVVFGFDFSIDFNIIFSVPFTTVPFSVDIVVQQGGFDEVSGGNADLVFIRPEITGTVSSVQLHDEDGVDSDVFRVFEVSTVSEESSSTSGEVVSVDIVEISIEFPVGDVLVNESLLDDGNATVLEHIHDTLVGGDIDRFERSPDP